MGISFSPFGLLIVLAVLFPNMIFMFLPPKKVPLIKLETEQYNSMFTVFERIGQAGVFILPVLFKASISSIADKLAFAGLILFLAVYYTGWIRFFAFGRGYDLLFSKLLFIPIPLAISPILYFMCAAKLMNSIPLFIAVIILTAGHLPISYSSYKRNL